MSSRPPTPRTPGRPFHHLGHECLVLPLWLVRNGELT